MVKRDLTSSFLDFSTLHEGCINEKYIKTLMNKLNIYKSDVFIKLG